MNNLMKGIFQEHEYQRLTLYSKPSYNWQLYISTVHLFM